MTTFNKDNFFLNTIAEFILVDKNKVDLSNPDFVSNSGSKYFYNKYGVYRYSDHWGSVASCFWALKSDSQESKSEVLAFCEWVNFGEIITLRQDDEAFKIDYDSCTRNCSFEEYFSEYKNLDIYEENKPYLFFEFGYLFNSEMNNNKIKSHPNHYCTETINVVKDFVKFHHLLDYKQKSYCDKCHFDDTDGYCACYSKEMEEQNQKELILREIEFANQLQQKKAPRKIRARKSHYLVAEYN